MSGKVLKPPAELDLFTGEEQRPTTHPPPGPARPGSTGPPLPSHARPLPRSDGRVNGYPEPDPNALRRVAGTTSVRLDPADREWLRLNRISVGEAVRAFVKAHRGDADVAAMREREQEAERHLAAVKAARSLVERGVSAKWAELDAARSVDDAIEKLRPDFQRYVGANETAWSHQVAWVRSRIERIRLLRHRDPRDVLDELRGST